MKTVHDDPYPTPEVRHITLLSLMLRMTKEERIQTRAAQLTDDDVADLMFLFTNSSYIDLDRPETIAGIGMLETKGLLGPGRANIILSSAVQPAERPS